MSLKIYGDFAIKFRAFGVTLGYARQSIAPQDAIPLPVGYNVPVPTKIPIHIDARGIKIDAFIITE